MSWLDQHIEEFVSPTIEELKSEESFAQNNYVTDYDRSFFKPLHYFDPSELTVIKNAWRSIKREAKGKPILLPGRDVFIFEVLARRENYPTKFIPECSRGTVYHYARILENLDEYFLFDTGFAGSIPQNLEIQNFRLMSAVDNDRQVFPRLSFSRSLALKIENSPKYWESGRLVNGAFELFIHPDPKSVVVTNEKISQPFSKLASFIAAACLTVEVYTNSAPKFINRHKPIPRNREGVFT